MKTDINNVKLIHETISLPKSVATGLLGGYVKAIDIITILKSNGWICEKPDCEISIKDLRKDGLRIVEATMTEVELTIYLKGGHDA